MANLLKGREVVKNKSISTFRLNFFKERRCLHHLKSHEREIKAAKWGTDWAVAFFLKILAN
jgi:hypothetical protein